MRRPVVLFLLLISLVWQSLSFAGQLSPLGPAQDWDHVLLHWQDAAHHHHEDGSFHQEDSRDAAIHIALDGALHAGAMIAAGFPPATPAARPLPAGIEQAAAPAPLIEGPRRPPRLPA
jgi:hypothetical protein